MASNEGSPEALAFQEHYSELVKGLLDPQSVAENLFSKRLISFQKLKEIGNFNLTTTQKCRVLVEDVFNTIIFQNPAVFHLFIDALEEERCSGSLASKLRLSFGPNRGNAPRSKRGRSGEAHSPESLLLAGAARKKMRSDEVSYPAEPVIPPGQSSVSNFTIHGPVQFQRDVYQEHYGTGTIYGGGVQQHQEETGSQQDHPDEAFTSLCDTVKALYVTRPEVKSDCWPPAHQSSFVNVALLNNDKFPYYDEFARQTVLQTADDIFEKKTNIEFDALFSEVMPGARILIEGRPGSGKTTLMNKLSREWAKGTVLKEVKLLLHIPLRRFYNKATLKVEDFVNLIDPKAYHNSKELQQALSTGEGVCVILDGIDEYKHSSDPGNLVREIMLCDRLPDAIIIAASRPSASQGFRVHATRRAEVLGFLRSQIAEYIKEHYGHVKENASRLLSYLQNHQNIHRMCYLPLHLAMVVYLNDILGGDCMKMPATETEVYLRFTTYSLLRDVGKDPNHPSLETLVSPEDLPHDKLLNFRCICALAFDQSISSQPIFSRKEITERFGAEHIELESLGLLSIDKQFTEVGVEETFSFLHLTFQEFLGAYYISRLPDQQSLECFRDYGELPHMSVTWKFFCGITQLKRDHELKVFELMIEKGSMLHLLHCASESQNKLAAVKLVSTTDGDMTIQKESLFATDCVALSFVLNNCEQQLRKLTLLSCRLGVEEFEILSQVDDNLLGLKSLCLRNTQIKKDALPSLARLLKRFPNLEELEISKCLSRVRNVKDLLPKLERLRVLRIDVAVGQELAERTFDVYPSLQQIRISGSSLVAESSKSSEGVTIGKLFCIEGVSEKLLFTGGSDSRISIVLKKWTQHDIEVVCIVLDWCPGVTHLEVCGDGFGRQGAATLALGSLRHLQTLHLSSNSIGPEGAAALSTALQFMTSLQNLYLGHNSVGDEGLRSLSGLLAGCTQLQELDLWRNELTDESVVCLTHLLNSLKDLKELDVEYNKFSEDGRRKLMQAAEARKGRPDFTETHLIV